MKAKTGIELIAEERRQQIEKHGFNEAHDDCNGQNQLPSAATWIISGDVDYWPDDWNNEWMYKIGKKSRAKQLVVAGALIAAEIDRLQAAALAT
jgi:hypothetical protein